ncbi:MAG: DNA polymerase III subunit alpha [Clostridiales bacterium]|jgi:DNA polymerase-3 subunit alpha|nr:DNA polymerase III subunit alpha [Clostridiales bacterium]
MAEEKKSNIDLTKIKAENFVHLHVHTEYSLLDGAARINKLFGEARANGMNAVAITDHGAMYGVVQFLKKASVEGIKPIVGCEFYTCRDISVRIYAPEDDENQNHLVLLAKNMKGYENLVKMNSIAFVDGFYYKPRIDLNILRTHSEGLICLSACLAGAIPQKLLRNDYDGAKAYAQTLKDIFNEDFYIEIQDHGLDEQKQTNPQLITIAREIGVKVVATNDVHYLKRSDAEMQDILLCVQTGKTLADTNRMKFPSDNFYLKTPEEMISLFPYKPEAIASTLEIADKCEVIELKKAPLMPYYIPENGQKPEEFLRTLTFERLKSRYPEPAQEVYDRIEYELDTIIRMGFAEYYLIVWDFIDYSKNHGIPVGPGRGSGVGSIVAYIIGITNVDPLKYDLIFERFLNPERVSAPDFDVDFCYEGRGKAIEYVINKYGKERVSQIVTFGTMASKAAIKDVGRVYGVPYAEVERITKLIPFGKNSIGEMIGLIESKEKDDEKPKIIPELRALYMSDTEAKKIINMAMELEGMPRNTSMHAAGVVICRDPVGEKIPLAKNGNEVTTQYNMIEIEELGLLKMDFLGLRTLTDIKKALEYIKEDKGVEIDFDKMSFDDPNVYELIASGETDAVFQLESAGMKKFMMQLLPTALEEIIAGISLYRPGPMDFIPQYVSGKRNPDKVSYAHQSLEPILSVTYGCIVYQEQVMRIVRELAGYSLGGADNVRRMMSKKKKEAMDAEEVIFLHGKEENGQITVEGALRRGVPLDAAKTIFASMAKFASYAFNKSHAAAYAYLSYETAYLKRYYPVHYITAVINNRIFNIDEITKYILILKENKIKVYPPDLNKSKVYFSVENEGVRFGLMGIKNIGEVAISAIIEDRNKNGAFQSIADFIERCDSNYINKRMIESLIKGGAMDCFGYPRSQLMGVYDRIVEVVTSDRKTKENGQFSFFDTEMDELKIDVKYPDINEYPENQKLTYEKEVLGMYISGHPLSDHLEKFKKLSFNMSMLASSDGEGESGEAEQTFSVQDDSFVTAGGVLTNLSKKLTKNGKMMAYGRLEDLYGSIEVVFFPSQYEKNKAKLVNDTVIKVGGSIRVSSEENPKILVNDVEVWSEQQPTDVKEAETSETKEHALNPPTPKQKTLYVKVEDDLTRSKEMIEEIFADCFGDTSVKIQYDGRVYDTGLKVDYTQKGRIWELRGIFSDGNLKYTEK